MEVEKWEVEEKAQGERTNEVVRIQFEIIMYLHVLSQGVRSMMDDFIKKVLDKVSDDQEGKVPVAFKFSDGTKVEHNFLTTSTVKV